MSRSISNQIVLSFLFIIFFLISSTSIVNAATLRVPQSYSTIQAAVSAAAAGDTILVSSGTYGGFSVNKQVIIAAENFDANNVMNNSVTINGPVSSSGSWAWDQGPTLRGFKITVSSDPIKMNNGPMIIEYNYFKGGVDIISFEGGGGIVRGNRIEGSSDDGIDIDGQSKNILIENNYILNSGEDGIEIRQQNVSISSMITATIRGNRIEGSRGGDGIQIMDYNNYTNRKYVMERNLFLKASRAAIGIMVGDTTTENYSAAAMPEPLFIVNNTFVGNTAGISGGANAVVLNNIFSGQTSFDLKNLSGKSVVKNTLFASTAKLQGTNNIESSTTITGDPALDSNYQLGANSRAVNTGIARYQHTYSLSNNQTVTEYAINLAANQYSGSAPDLGWKEYGGLVQPTSVLPTSITQPTAKPVTPTTIPTSGSGNTTINIQIFLHGIGKGGDNVNPTSGGNNAPLRVNRNAVLEFFNSSNALTATVNSTTVFNGTTGSFQANTSVNNLSSGIYTIKVRVPGYLRKQYPGIVTINANQVNNLPSITLVTGDTNQDNSLSILDYNLIYDCFSEIAPARNCDSIKKLNTDITDDGKVNQFDYNLFLRELSVQIGVGENENQNPQTASCLLQPGTLRTVSGVQTTRYDTRSNLLAANTKINASNALWRAVHDYPVIVSGGEGICFHKGTIEGQYAQTATWDLMHGTTAMELRTKKSTVESLRVHNYGDGISMKDDASDFTINGVYLSYIRDDCIENDFLHSGVVENSLFDGCYEAFSARTHSGQDPKPNGTNNLWVIRNNLIRLQPMEKVYQDRGIIPGHDGFFKWDSTGVSPKLSLHNNIFRADQNANNVGLGIPQGKLVDCENNIMVWLGSGSYPEALPETLNGKKCFTVSNDKSIWDLAVANWKTQHSF